MQRIRRGKYFSPCKLGETPIAQALRNWSSRTHAALWNFRANGVEIMRAAGCKLPQTRAQRSGKRESKSSILLLELIQRSRTHAPHSREKYLSPCKLGETPIVQALRGTIGQVEPMQRCGISAPTARKLCAQQGAIPSNESPAKRVSFESVSKIYF